MPLTNYYNFKEGSGTVLNDLVGTANGTVEGTNPAPVWNANGYIYFNGDNGTITGDRARVRFANKTPFQKTTNDNFTFVVIFRTTATANANLHYLINTGSSVTWGETRLIISTTRQIYFGADHATENRVKVSHNNSSLLNDGKWHVGILRFAGVNTLENFIDGVFYQLTTNNTFVAGRNLFNNTYNVVLACEHTGASYRNDFKGDICNFQNYNHTLSNAEVTDITNEFELLM